MPKEGSLSIVYEEQEPCPTIPVGGAHGGPSPDGSLVVAHVFTESGTVPALEEHAVGEDGRVDLTKGNAVRRSDLTRKVLATLVLSPESAIRVGTWLVEKGKQAQNIRSQNPAQ